MALEQLVRPAPQTPSLWESSLLEKRHLSLACLEFGLPQEVAIADALGLVEKDGTLMTALYSRAAFVDLLEQGQGDSREVAAYVLPHLSLADARELQITGRRGGSRFRIANPPRLEAKVAAFTKLQRVRAELATLEAPVENLLDELDNRLSRLASILDADLDTNLGHGAVLQNQEVTGLLARWERRLGEARDSAAAVRRRVILAVQHEICFGNTQQLAREDLHDTIFRLAPELHQRIYGDPKHTDPCDEADVDDADWECREKRTKVAVGNLVREIGLEMDPHDFILFSLMRSRRELIEAEAEVCRQELRLRVMRSIEEAVRALTTLRNLDEEVGAHFVRPSLLGNQVDHDREILPEDCAFYPEYAHLSQEELQERVRHHTSGVF